MRALIDTNVLLDLALDREPFADDASQLLDAAQAGRLSAWVAWHAVSDFYYLCASDKDDRAARQFISDLLSFAEVASGSTESVRQALSWNLRDFEDSLQCAAAIACGAELVVTRNVRGYRRAPVRALSPSETMALIQ